MELTVEQSIERLLKNFKKADEIEQEEIRKKQEMG